MKVNGEYRKYAVMFVITFMAAIISIGIYIYLNKDRLYPSENHLNQMSWNDVCFSLPEEFDSPYSMDTSLKRERTYYTRTAENVVYLKLYEIYLHISLNKPDNIKISGNDGEYITSERYIRKCAIETPWGQEKGTYLIIGDVNVLCFCQDKELEESIVDSVRANEWEN